MRRTERGRKAGRGVWPLALAAAVAGTACQPLQQGSVTPSNQANNGFTSLLAWTGVKVVKETLAPNPGADAGGPVAVAGGIGGRIYVQWNATATATISQFTPSGTELAAVPAYTMGGR